MKKSLSFLVLVFVAVVLVACTKKPVDNRTVITYAAWNLGTVEENNIERRMIKAFEDAHPDYRVDVINRPKKIDAEGNEVDATWNELFNNLASAGNMPDVFQVDNVPNAIVNGWAQDITDVVKNDADFLNVPTDITDSARYDGKLFALPQAMFYFGYFINRTAIQKSSRDSMAVTYGMTYDNFMLAASKNWSGANLGEDGILGINGMNSLINWLPAQYDATLGWFTNNDAGYHLNSAAFKQALDEQAKYYVNNAHQVYPYVAEAYDQSIENVATAYKLHFGASPWHNGQQSMLFEGSYNLRGFLAATLDSNNPLHENDIDFIGTPSVDGVQRVPIVLDYIGVGRGTDIPEMAYEFAKWMGFGVDGYRMRLKIATETPEAGAVNFAPIVQDEALMDEYFALYPTLTEFKKLVTGHQDFIIESVGKIVPGYWISRGSAKYDENLSLGEVLDQLIKGELAYSQDVANNLNKAANDAYTTAKQALDEALARLG